MSNHDEPEIPLRDIGLKARNLKCFGDEPQGFDRILPINVVIGRNNSGKSALLDLVEYACTRHIDRWRGRNEASPEAIIEREFSLLDSECLASGRAYLEINNSTRTMWSARLEAQSHIVGKRIRGILTNQGNVEGIEFASDDDIPLSYSIEKLRFIAKTCSGRVGGGLDGGIFRRLMADRDVAPEFEDGTDALGFASDGKGFTSSLEKLLHDDHLDEGLVELALLSALNDIFEPEQRFTRIVAQRDKRSESAASATWEIKLHEEGGAVVPLSQMGSGVKTVLLVLANLLVVPELREGEEKVSLSQYVFAFEELENNLHPALQRRLFAFIRDFAREHGSTFFITTHSNVVIDFFSRDEDAQLIHVMREGDESRARTVELASDHSLVLDDLGVRASDLLQTNVVVWVEGPSDRVYFNAWIKELAGDELQQGLHYQCVFYGGSVLSHFTMEEGDAADGEVKDLVEAMRVCRKAVLLADSDRREEEDGLKPRLQRVIREAGEGCLTWVTPGREVERYAPGAVLTDLLGEEAASALYGDLPEKVARSKVEFARRVVEHEGFTAEAIRATLDLGERMDEVIAFIREANGL